MKYAAARTPATLRVPGAGRNNVKSARIPCLRPLEGAAAAARSLVLGRSLAFRVRGRRTGASGPAPRDSKPKFLATRGAHR